MPMGLGLGLGLSFVQLVGGGVTPPPGPTDLTLRTTDAQFLDLATDLAAVSSSTPILVTVSGPATANVWPYQNANGKAWYKNELLNAFMLFTAGATSGQTGYVQLTWSGGSVTKYIEVSDAAPTTWTIGKKTLAGFGGFPIGYLAGTASDWTIKTQTLGDGVTATTGFTINTDTRRVCWAGTYASATRTIGTPATGVDAYRVTLQNLVLGQEHTVSFTVNANEWNLAKSVSLADQVPNDINTSHSFGDYILWENDPADTWTSPTVYASIASPFTSGTVARPNTTGGVAAPTGPFAGDSWTPSTSYAAGWIQHRPRNPLAARITKYNQDNRNYIDGGLYLRFSFFNEYGMGDPWNITCNIAAQPVNQQQTAWVMWDHNVGDQFRQLNNRDRNINLFWCENYALNTPGSFAAYDLNGRDIIAYGNWSVGAIGDAVRLTTYNSVNGNEKSKVWFNVVKDKKNGGGSIHGDFFQLIFQNSTSAPLYYATTGTYEFPTMVGNIGVRGEGTVSGSTALQDGQGIAGGNVNTATGYAHRLRVVGFLYSGSFVNGIAPKQLASGSYVRKSTLAFAPAPAGTTGESGYQGPALQMYAGTDAGSALEVTDTAIFANGNQFGGLPAGFSRYDNAGTTAGTLPPAPTVTNCRGGINSQTAWVASTTQTFTCIQDILDAFTPTPGGPLTVAGGASSVIGAVGTADVDFRLRTFNAALLT